MPTCSHQKLLITIISNFFFYPLYAHTLDTAHSALKESKTSPFTTNPSIILSTEDKLGYYTQKSFIKNVATTDDTTSTADTKPIETARISIDTTALSYTLGLGDGFSAQANLFYEDTAFDTYFEEQNSPFTTEYDTAKEVFTRYGGSLKVAAELTPDLSVGISFSYLNQKANILGNMWTDQTDRTEYSGNLTKLGIGAQFKTDSALLGLAWQTGFKGKMDVPGEEKVYAEPNRLYANIDVNLEQFIFSLNYLMNFYQKNELRDRTTSPSGNTNSVYLLGIPTLRNQFLVNKIGGSLGANIFESVTVEANISYITNEWIYDETSLPEDIDSDSELKANTMEYCLSLQVDTDSVASSIGGCLEQGSHDIKASDDRTINQNTKNLNIIAQLNIKI